jgi:hypothetical protein
MKPDQLNEGDMKNEQEQRFDTAMMEIYRRALKEAKYNATRYLQMLHNHGGLATAQILIHSPTVSEGYTALWERHRLDLTIEALVLQPGWDGLFSEEELAICRQRLLDYGYQF